MRQTEYKVWFTQDCGCWEGQAGSATEAVILASAQQIRDGNRREVELVCYKELRGTEWLAVPAEEINWQIPHK